MSLTLRTALGYTEAVIDEDGSLKRFYLIADILKNNFEIAFTNKEDNFDAISWDFLFGPHRLTLYYSIYNGVSVYPSRTGDARKKENAAVVELAHVLEGKLMSIDMKHITV